MKTGELTGTKVLWIVRLIFLIAGVSFVIAGIGTRVAHQRRRKLCTQVVPAVIADVSRTVSRDADGHRREYWYPVYEYTVNGMQFRTKGAIAVQKGSIVVGESVELYVNPEDPEMTYDPKDKYGLLSLIFGVVGGALLIMTAVLFLFVKPR